METYTGYFDASVRGEHYYIGCVVYNSREEVILSKTMKFWNKGYSDKSQDSNMAEFLSLLQLLTEINRNKIKQITIMGDNRSVIECCVGGGRVKTRYQSVHREIRELMSSLEYLNLQFVKRNNNKVADKMCREAYKESVQREMVLCI